VEEIQRHETEPTRKTSLFEFVIAFQCKERASGERPEEMQKREKGSKNAEKWGRGILADRGASNHETRNLSEADRGARTVTLW